MASTVSIIFAAVLATSFISGLLSLGGGTILMGVFGWILPISVAMMLHGVTQLTSNGARAVMYWRHIHWPVIGGYVLGAAAITAVFSIFAYVPNKVVFFLLLGSLPFVNYLLPRGYALDITRRWGGVGCGAVNTASMLLSGVSGPILDLFFVKSGLTRYQTHGTKGLIQSFTHIIKIGYFGTITLMAGDFEAILPWWVFAVAAVLAAIGNVLARKYLHALSDEQFRAWTQRLTLAIGVVFLTRGITLWLEV